MSEQPNQNGHDSTSSGSKNSSKVRYLFAPNGSKKELAKPKDDEAEVTELDVQRFPMWLVVTAYVLIALTVLYAVWGLISSLSR